MKKFIYGLIFFVLSFTLLFNIFLLKNTNQNSFAINNKNNIPKMCIVIDDFGSYDQSGIETLMKSNAPITCAIIPFVDNSKLHYDLILKKGFEPILHMPMESHVNLPKDWYGPVYIKNNDSEIDVKNKLQNCLNEFKNIKGFNIHIGSGVSQNKNLMNIIYNFAKENDLYFLDSRTILTTATEDACKDTNSIYLGRDVFLEADKNKSYSGVCYRLLEGAKIAQEKGYSIVIGHIGAEGGENTSNAILDTIPKIEKMGVKIVTLNEIYQDLNQEKTQK